MALTHNNDNIESVKHGTDELAKIYVGDDLVFEHDKPVWLVTLYNVVKYSLDGINYNTLGSWKSHTSIDNCYANKLFFIGKTDEPNLKCFSTSNISKGIQGTIVVTPGIEAGAYSLASDGEKTIFVCSRRDTSYIVYSKDGGKVWQKTSSRYSPSKLRYIGNKRFWFEFDSDKNVAGRLYYFDADRMTNLWYQQYYLPDNSALDEEINDAWLCNKDVNNQNLFYVCAGKGSNSKVYVGTAYNRATAQVIGLPAAVTNNDSVQLRYPVYMYGKYYAIVYHNNVTNDGRGYIYTSSDGITFTKLTALQNKKFTELYKMNGKLCYRDYREAGVIHQDNSFEYTLFTSADAEYDMYTGDYTTLACNRFPRL